MTTENGDPTSTANELSLAERIAIVESRLVNERKTWLDRLKEYGGVAALVIAIGYSFPLGVWKEFFVLPDERRAAHIGMLKEVLGDTMQLVAENVSAAAQVSSPDLRDMITRAGSTRLLLIMTKYKDDFVAEKEAFLPEELIAIGLNFQYIYQVPESIQFFSQALSKSAQGSFAKIEAARQLGKSYFFPSPLQDTRRGRSRYRDTLASFTGSRDLRLVVQEITLRSEWGLLEMLQGDWACGQLQMDEALRLLRIWQPAINDQGNMMLLLQQKRASLMQSSGQSATGCN